MFQQSNWIQVVFHLRSNPLQTHLGACSHLTEAVLLELIVLELIMLTSSTPKKITNDNHHAAEHTRGVELEASVVDVKHAAGADDAGLVNPLLKKSQQHLLPQKVIVFLQLPSIE